MHKFKKKRESYKVFQNSKKNAKASKAVVHLAPEMLFEIIEATALLDNYLYFNVRKNILNDVKFITIKSSVRPKGEGKGYKMTVVPLTVLTEFHPTLKHIREVFEMFNYTGAKIRSVLKSDNLGNGDAYILIESSVYTGRTISDDQQLALTKVYKSLGFKLLEVEVLEEFVFSIEVEDEASIERYYKYLKKVAEILFRTLNVKLKFYKEGNEIMFSEKLKEALESANVKKEELPQVPQTPFEKIIEKVLLKVKPSNYNLIRTKEKEHLYEIFIAPSSGADRLPYSIYADLMRTAQTYFEELGKLVFVNMPAIPGVNAENDFADYYISTRMNKHVSIDKIEHDNGDVIVTLTRKPSYVEEELKLDILHDIFKGRLFIQYSDDVRKEKEVNSSMDMLLNSYPNRELALTALSILLSKGMKLVKAFNIKSDARDIVVLEVDNDKKTSIEETHKLFYLHEKLRTSFIIDKDLGIVGKLKSVVSYLYHYPEDFNVEVNDHGKCLDFVVSYKGYANKSTMCLEYLKKLVAYYTGEGYEVTITKKENVKAVKAIEVKQEEVMEGSLAVSNDNNTSGELLAADSLPEFNTRISKMVKLLLKDFPSVRLEDMKVIETQANGFTHRLNGNMYSSKNTITNADFREAVKQVFNDISSKNQISVQPKKYDSATDDKFAVYAYLNIEDISLVDSKVVSKDVEVEVSHVVETPVAPKLILDQERIGKIKFWKPNSDVNIRASRNIVYFETESKHYIIDEMDYLDIAKVSTDLKDVSLNRDIRFENASVIIPNVIPSTAKELLTYLADIVEERRGLSDRLKELDNLIDDLSL